VPSGVLFHPPQKEGGPRDQAFRRKARCPTSVSSAKPRRRGAAESCRADQARLHQRQQVQGDLPGAESQFSWSRPSGLGSVRRIRLAMIHGASTLGSSVRFILSFFRSDPTVLVKTNLPHQGSKQRARRQTMPRNTFPALTLTGKYLLRRVLGREEYTKQPAAFDKLACNFLVE